MVSNQTWPFGRILIGVTYLINPNHKMECSNILGSFTAERTMLFNISSMVSLSPIYPFLRWWFMEIIIISESCFCTFE